MGVGPLDVLLNDLVLQSFGDGVPCGCSEDKEDVVGAVQSHVVGHLLSVGSSAVACVGLVAKSAALLVVVRASDVAE